MVRIYVVCLPINPTRVRSSHISTCLLGMKPKSVLPTPQVFGGEMVEPWFNWEIHRKSMLNAIFLGWCWGTAIFSPQGFPPVEVSQRHRAHGQRGGARQQPSARVTAAWGNDGSWSLGIGVIGGRPDFQSQIWNLYGNVVWIYGKVVWDLWSFIGNNGG
jgi:hypothetical protein